MRNAKKIIILLGIFSLVADVSGQWFRRKDNDDAPETSSQEVEAEQGETESNIQVQNPSDVQRQTHKVLNASQAQDFITQVAARTYLLENMRHLNGALGGAEQAVNELVSNLKTNFNYDALAAHRMDSATMTLLLIPAGEDNSEPQVLYHFGDREELQQFRSMITTRNQRMNQVRALRELVNERQALISQINEYLFATYQIEPDKNYHFDNEINTIFKLLQP